MNHLILYCRTGFESELAAEIADRAGMVGVAGYPRTEAGSGYVLYCTYQDDGADVLMQQLDFRDLIFARQWFASPGLMDDLPSHDRIGTLLPQLEGFPQCGELVVETADTNDAKELTGFCRKFTSPCATALRKAGILSAKRTNRLPRLHLMFISSHAVFAGYSDTRNSAKDPMGIPRLRFPADAPSRSTLKLEEAWLSFLNRKQQEHLLQPGMTAVDLGAAPGGWTYQLVKHHIRVAAVDNGPMAPSLMDSGIVTHVQADGFKYQPPKTVDWLVCDMAEKPSRVAGLMAKWLQSGWCRQAVFNLKLPMKKRYQAVLDAIDIIDGLLAAESIPYELAIKHLYHDREEVTCFLRRV